MSFDYDLFVIGAGSGGVRAARIASGHGAKVAIAEEYRVGGTCVIRGCVPKKLMVHAARYAEDFADATGFGWSGQQKARFDWRAFMAAKDAEIARLNSLYIKGLESAGVEILHTRAEFAGPHELYLVNEERTVTAEKILIATGAAPFVPHNVPGAAFAITSNEAFHLESLPKSMAIIGGGYIAVEFAGVFHALGVETTLLYRGKQILRGFDDDLREHLSREMTRAGVTVMTHANVDRITRHDHGLGGYTVHCANGETVQAEEVMYAAGREPYTFDLHLELAGVEMAANDAIKVDAFNRTSAPHIWAVGDVTNRAQLTPVAIREGHAFADRVFGGRDIPPLDYSIIPTAVFSHPEIGTVGLTEREARARHGAVDIYKSTFRPLKHTLSGRGTRMLMKLVVHPETDVVLGAHLCGPDAAEMIQLLGILLKTGARKADFDATIAVHPTAAEELVTMREKQPATD